MRSLGQDDAIPFPYSISLRQKDLRRLLLLDSGLLNVDADRPERSQNQADCETESVKLSFTLFNRLTYNDDYIMPQANNISTLPDEDVLIILRDISLRSLLRIRQVNSNSRTY